MTSVIIVSILLVVATFAVLNKLLTNTNWWKNIFVFTKQFEVSGNYDIVNVGSNPARFAFDYEGVKGENWSTGTQGLDMDLVVLKAYNKCLNKEATIILPIVPFSSVSGSLGIPKRPQYLCKFVRIAKRTLIDNRYKICKTKWYLRFPLLFKPKAIQLLLRDVKKDERLIVSEQHLQQEEMELDAKKWVDLWKKEFNISDLNGKLPAHLKNGRDKSIEMMCEMVGYILKCGYNPIIVSPPMSASLMQYFTDDVRNTYIYSFVKSVQEKYDVQYLDYMDSEFVDNKYYFNALYMNLVGRRNFTKRVLIDLGVL
jgi:hypothetical protein